MPALERPAQIRLPARQGKHSNQRPQSSLASAQVLEFLLPQLVEQGPGQAKQYKMLAGVDHYMLQETTELISRLGRLHRSLNIEGNTEIHLNCINGKVEIRGDSQACQTLAAHINSDSWLPGALGWLHPNYLMLAQSLEISDYSWVYQQSPGLAIRQYPHLAWPDKGIRCYLQQQAGKVRLRLESPLNIYHLAPLRPEFKMDPCLRRNDSKERAF